jgi:hypothetical protein
MPPPRTEPTRNVPGPCDVTPQSLLTRRATVNGLIYLIGLIVVILFILSFLGLR